MLPGLGLMIREDTDLKLYYTSSCTENIFNVTDSKYSINSMEVPGDTF